MRIGKWTLTEELHVTDIRLKVSDGWHCEWPIRYWNGDVAWDYPEIVPMAVKQAAKRMLDAINARLCA